MARLKKLADARFNIMGYRRPAMYISLALMVISVIALALRGLNFGIDFTGGYVVEAGFEQPADLGGIRSSLADNGFDDAVVQFFGTQSEVMVRLAARGVCRATSG